MLGVYTNFPITIHETAEFSASISTKKLQKSLIEAFHKLNSESLALEKVGSPSIPNCTAKFEFGVADGVDFNYIDGEERKKLLENVEKRPFQILDFLCMIHYHKARAAKTALKSDCYMLRFRFFSESTQLKVFHEKGLMYVLPKDLPEFIANQINTEHSRTVVRLQEQ